MDGFFLACEPGAAPRLFGAWLPVVGVAVALLAVFSGCGEPRYVHYHCEPQFLPETVDVSTPAACRMVIPQADPVVAPKETKPDVLFSDQNGGLVNLAIDVVQLETHSLANSIRRSNAAKMSAPLAGQGLGAAFQGEFQSELSAACRASPWLGKLLVEPAPANGPPAADAPSLLQVSVSYYLSYDASRLIVQANLDYYRRGQPYEAYGRRYTYYSDPVGSEIDEAAVARWTAAGHDLLRRRMQEGTREIVDMVWRDFLNPAPMPGAELVTLSCYDAQSLAPVQWTGRIRRNGGPRVVFEDLGGDYFSVIADHVTLQPR